MGLKTSKVQRDSLYGNFGDWSKVKGAGKFVQDHKSCDQVKSNFVEGSVSCGNFAEVQSIVSSLKKKICLRRHRRVPTLPPHHHHTAKIMRILLHPHRGRARRR